MYQLKVHLQDSNTYIYGISANLEFKKIFYYSNIEYYTLVPKILSPASPSPGTI